LGSLRLATPHLIVANEASSPEFLAPGFRLRDYLLPLRRAAVLAFIAAPASRRCRQKSVSEQMKDFAPDSLTAASWR
jgi:hypothetical protein